MSAKWVALGLFGLGAIVFTLLEITIPGLILLTAAFLLGVYTIASPEQLADDGSEGDDASDDPVAS